MDDDKVVGRVSTDKERREFIRSMCGSPEKNLELLAQFERDIAHAVMLARKRLTQDPPIPMKAAYRLRSHVTEALDKCLDSFDITYGSG